MKKLSWHKRLFLKLRNDKDRFDRDRPLPKTNCGYIGEWLGIILFLVFLVGILGLIIWMCLWSLISAFFGKGDDQIMGIIFSSVILGVILIATFVTYKDKLKARFCKPIKWD